ncbi:MAG: CpaF family protein [Actinomycetota bacterium]|nr:CpaF family protein [Actinomycetota bacterium]
MSLYERLSRGQPEGPSNGTPAQPVGNGHHTAGNGHAHNGRSVDPLVDVKRKVHHQLLLALGPKLYDMKLSAEQLDARVREILTEVLQEEATPLSADDRRRVVAETVDDVLGYGPIEPLLRDATVTEVMANGPGNVYVERNGKIVQTEVRFFDDAHLRRTIEKIVGQVGRRIDEAQPYVDARLADGSRVNAVIPPLALDGPALTIRKFAAEPFIAADLVTLGTFPDKVSRFLDACVRGRTNILVSGGTGAGKTTTLNVLSSFIPDDERIITIEDAAELRLQQPHVVRLESRPPNIEGKGHVTIRDLVRNALRMRPDRIVVGEVRGGEALDMLQAMNTGHDGSISTIHANSPRDVLSRLETMVLMAGMDLPVRAIREQISSAIQLIVHQSRLRDGTRRITHVSEIVGMEGDVITLQDLFLFDHSMGRDEGGRSRGQLKATGLRPKFSQKLEDVGIRLEPELFELSEPILGGRW